MLERTHLPDNFKRVAVTNRKLIPGYQESNECAGGTSAQIDVSLLLLQLNRLLDSPYDMVILREKDLTAEQYETLARQAIAINPNIVLHSYVDVAKKLNHPYIHLPFPIIKELADKLADKYPDARKSFTTMGVSIHSLEEARLAEELGATYVTAGHVFDTNCKKGLPGRGIPWLKTIVDAVSIPVYAIGGMEEAKLLEVSDTGALGACFMSEAMRA